MTGRFAPSPTSDLHLGNLRTALLAWLFARSTNQDFILRIEDLDAQRVAAAPGAAQRQISDLAKLGLDWDQDIQYQSQHLDRYRGFAAKLDTYECFCTRREIAAAVGAPHGDYRPYPGTCAHLTEKERASRRLTRKPAIRVRAGSPTFTVYDRHAGQISAVVDDFVLFRADGAPAYNLAVVVDDGLSKVSQVVRGHDLLDSSPRQAWLATQLGFKVPEYIHVSLAVTTSGNRLAKRDGAVTLNQLSDHGIDVVGVHRQLCRSIGLPPADSPCQLLANLPKIWWANPKIWQDWVVKPRFG